MLSESPAHVSAWLRPLGCLAAVLGGVAEAAPLDFNRDIRPILSENCFQCHGQDPAKREGKLRLDERASATQLRDGFAAILPGRPTESEVMRRIVSND
ncbi:MAG: c-type cytochrome domain-containing protein, partial [Gammaproteobacteria bacterium]